MSTLAGKTVLVIGASGGLGSEIADQLQAEGGTAVRHSRAQGDLRDTPSVARLVADAVAVTGHLDGLVIAAGVVAFGPADALEDSTLDELFAVNTIAPIRLIRDARPHLAASAAAGSEPFVITISGIVADAPTAGLAAYSASKAGLAGFVKAISREFRRDGIRVMDARPGHTETQLSQHPIAGTAPAFPAGHDPRAVAARIVRAILDDEKDLPSTAFTS